MTAAHLWQSGQRLWERSKKSVSNRNRSYERTYEIGKYSRMRHRYSKEHRKIQYTTMILDGTLYDHLKEIDRICNERMETMVAAIKKQQGITEELKARDQLAWVGAMNNIRSAAEEVICAEVIYT